MKVACEGGVCVIPCLYGSVSGCMFEHRFAHYRKPSASDIRKKRGERNSKLFVNPQTSTVTSARYRFLSINDVRTVVFSTDF